WRFRGGSAPVDVATRLANGVVGTPMPSFIDSVEKPEDVWHLANYILSLGPRTLTYATLVSVTNVSDAIPDDPDAAFWKAIAPNHIALLGQVIVDPRNFNPSIDLVSVRAVYHDKEIAFHLTWDDPMQSVEDAAKKTYADAISLQFPPQPRPGPERPYFLMGDASDGVYLLRWQNGKGVTEATANGPTKIVPLAGSEATAKAVYANGQYRLVIKRPLASKHPDRLTFQPAVFTPVAFQAPDGAPVVEKLKINKDTQQCGTEAEVDRVMVGSNKGLANAVVSVPTAKGAPRMVKATVDQHGCKFVPHVSAMMPGELELKNSDGIL